MNMSVKYDGDDRYLDPDTGILRNKLGLTTQQDLDRAESAFVALATGELSFSPLTEPKAGPDFSYLRSIHGKLFGDVYDWAGKFRDVDISKGSTRFASFRFIENEGNRLSLEMAQKKWLSNLPHEEFADQAAHFFGEMNSLHPFREGNGRSLREYIRYIAERAGHKLTWEGLDREEMTRASIIAHNSSHYALRDIIAKQMSCCG